MIEQSIDKKNFMLFALINKGCLSIEFIRSPPALNYLTVFPDVCALSVSFFIDKFTIIFVTVWKDVIPDAHFHVVCPFSIIYLSISRKNSVPFFLAVKPLSFIVISTNISIFAKTMWIAL